MSRFVLIFITAVLLAIYLNRANGGENKNTRLGDALKNSSSSSIANGNNNNNSSDEQEDNVLKREAKKKLRDCGVEVSDDEGDGGDDWNKGNRRNGRNRKVRNRHRDEEDVDGDDGDDRSNRFHRLSGRLNKKENRNPYKNFHLGDSDNDDDDDGEEDDSEEKSKKNSRRGKKKGKSKRKSEEDSGSQDDDDDDDESSDNHKNRRRNKSGKRGNVRNRDECNDDRDRRDGRNPYYGGRNDGNQWGGRTDNPYSNGGTNYRGSGYDYGFGYMRPKRSRNSDDEDNECLSQCIFGYLEILDDSRVPSETMLIKWLQDNIPNNDLKRIKALREARRCFARLTTSDMQDGCEFSKELAKCLELDLEK